MYTFGLAQDRDPKLNVDVPMFASNQDIIENVNAPSLGVYYENMKLHFSLMTKLLRFFQC